MEDLQYLSVLKYLEHLEDHKVFEIIKILEKRKFKLHVMNYFHHRTNPDKYDIMIYILRQKTILSETKSLGCSSLDFITKNGYYIEIEWRNQNVNVEYLYIGNNRSRAWDYPLKMTPLYSSKYDHFIDSCFEILASICSLPNKQ